MAYRDTELPSGGSYGSTLRSEPRQHTPEPRHHGVAGTLTGGLLVTVLLILGLLVGIGTLSVGGEGETPAAPGLGASGSEAGWSGGTNTAPPPEAPVN